VAAFSAAAATFVQRFGSAMNLLCRGFAMTPVLGLLRERGLNALP